VIITLAPFAKCLQLFALQVDDDVLRGQVKSLGCPEAASEKLVPEQMLLWARQLAKLIHRPVIWFWGHEHKLAIYEKFSVKDGIEAYGRCMGHGGMPVERGAAPDILDCRWLAWDNRRYPSDEELDVGYNGYANLSLNGPALHIAYYDLNQSLVLTEDWHIDIESGALEGPRLKKVLDDPSLHCRDA